MNKVDRILEQLQQKVSSMKDFDQRILKSQLFNKNQERGESIFPIAIVNSSLLTPYEENSSLGGGDLLPELELHKDYYLLPESLWSKFISWGIFTVDCDIATVLTPVSG